MSMDNYLGKDTPKLGFGLMRLPTLPGGTDKDIDIELVKKMVDLYLERGYTYFDTAFMYHGGMSEEALRQAVVERYPRERYTVTDKMPLWDIKGKQDYENIFQTQLKRTGLSYFDYYFLHGIGEGSLETLDKTGGWDYMKELKERGLVKHIGFSFHSPAACLEKILDAHPEVELVQLQINYVDWESESVQSRLCYEACQKHNVPITIMEPIRGGSLAAMHPDAAKIISDYSPDKSPAYWALRFCASLNGLIACLSGMSNLEQVDENTRVMKDMEPLTEAYRAMLGEVVKKLESLPTIPCTGCKYCITNCPKEIPTPAIINMLNEYTKYQNLRGSKRSYGMMTGRGGGKASDCIGCKSCEDHCPQHLPITELLKKAADLFEG